MPSIDVAKATSSSEQPEARRLLYRGGIVEIKIPMKFKEGSYPLPDLPDGTRKQFLQFPWYVKGGVVKGFYHLRDGEKFESLKGKRVITDVEVWEKILPDGRRYRHVDLGKSGRAMRKATHTLTVLAVDKDKIVLPAHSRMFKVLNIGKQELTGTIVIVPVGSKIAFKTEQEVSSADKPARVVHASQHSELYKKTCAKSAQFKPVTEPIQTAPVQEPLILTDAPLAERFAANGWHVGQLKSA